jgi:hypothetical protein
LHRYKPALAYHFGIRPWEIDKLTWAEFEQFCQAADELNKPIS